MKADLFSSPSSFPGKRVFTVTLWSCIENCAIEDYDAWLYKCNTRPEYKRQIKFSALLREGDERSLSELEYEYKATGSILSSNRVERSEPSDQIMLGGKIGS